MNFLVENWLTLMGFLSAPVMYFLGGRQEKNQQLKKGDVEIETAEVDYAVKVRELYESLLEQANKDKESLKLDKDAIITEFKSEREYLRTQIDELKKQASNMQDQFNSIQLAYAKEVEQSQNWEKLHRELLAKYNSLEALYEKLKDDFDKHKKAAK
jgi:plasmid replication initiation protein